MSDTTDKKRDHKNYFPRPMPFADFNYNEYPDAIYTVDIERFSIESKTIGLQASFYASPADFDAGKPPISERDGGIRRIIYRGVEFDAFVAANAEAIADVVALLHSVFSSLSTVPNPQTGAFESFFKNAGEVIYPEAMRGKK